MLPTTEKYRYVTEGNQERAVALEKDQRIYAQAVDLHGSVDEKAVAELEKTLAPLLEKQTALLKSGRVPDARKVEAEISVRLKETAPDTVKKLLPDNADQDGRDARKILSYVVATALVNYVNKDIYDGVSHETDKDGNARLRELEPREKTFKNYLLYSLNRAADGYLPEEERPRPPERNGDQVLRSVQEEKIKNDAVIRKNFSNPKNRKKAMKTAEKKGRPLTEKEIKVMKLKAAGGQGK